MVCICQCSFKQGYLTCCSEHHRVQAVQQPLNMVLKFDLEMDYVKESVFGVSGVAPIMAKDYSALQELLKTHTSELSTELPSARVPHVLRGRCSLLSDEGSARRLEDQQVLY